MKTLLKKNADKKRYENAVKLANYVRKNLRVGREWFIDVMAWHLEVDEEILKNMSVRLIIYTYDEEITKFEIDEYFCEP